MTLRDWAVESVRRIGDDGVSGLSESARELYIGALRRVDRVYPVGVPLYDRDWDVAIVLDACRYDLMTEVVSQYPVIRECDPFYIRSSHSGNFIRQNFNEPRFAEHVSNTAYITGNPQTANHYTGEQEFEHLDEVWRDEWDDELGTVRPESITRRAIGYYRDEEPERMILHYMQPHYPYVPEPFGPESGMKPNSEGTDNAFDLLQRGEISREEHWRRYRENLEYVLDHLVETLLENLQADDVVITADHGNLFGEYGLYAHPVGVPLPQLRRVPWCPVETTDEESITGETPSQPEQSGDDVERRLRDLGYKE